MNYLDIIPAFIKEESITDQFILETVRAWRNQELGSCDWTQLADAPVDKVAWAQYRQELRDLPAQNEDPKLIVFPERP
jgi:hypothetical protein